MGAYLVRGCARTRRRAGSSSSYPRAPPCVPSSRDLITKLERQKQREIDSLLTPLIARTLCVPVVVLAIIVVFNETIQVHSTTYFSFLPLFTVGERYARKYEQRSKEIVFCGAYYSEILSSSPLHLLSRGTI